MIYSHCNHGKKFGLVVRAEHAESGA